MHDSSVPDVPSSSTKASNKVVMPDWSAGFRFSTQLRACHGSPKANFAHRGKVDLVCLYVVPLGSLERVEHDCSRKAAADQFLSHCDSTIGRVVSC